MRPIAPNRASGKFTIQAGLLSIPVKIYTHTEDASIKRQEYLADGRKVGRVAAVKNADGTYGEQVDKRDVVKKFETSRGLIDLSDDEIDRAITGTVGVADIVAVHPYDVYDNHYTPSGLIYQVRAEAAGNKALALILAALGADENFALLRWVSSGVARVGALFPNGNLFVLRYDDEVRELKDLDTPQFSAAEFSLARQLLAESVVPNPLPLEHPSNLVREYAEGKAAGILPAVVKKEEAPTGDIIAALKASLLVAANAHKEANA